MPSVLDTHTHVYVCVCLYAFRFYIVFFMHKYPHDSHVYFIVFNCFLMFSLSEPLLVFYLVPRQTVINVVKNMKNNIMLEGSVIWI